MAYERIVLFDSTQCFLLLVHKKYQHIVSSINNVKYVSVS